MHGNILYHSLQSSSYQIHFQHTPFDIVYVGSISLGVM